MKKLMVFGISLFLLFLSLVSSSVSAGYIEITYPSEVNAGEVFEINLALSNFSLDIYDVKIEVLKNDTQESIDAEIKDQGSWHDTFNYVNDIINTSGNNQSTFSINITENYEGPSFIEVKVRDSLNNSQTFSGYELNVLYEEPAQEEEPEIDLKLDWEIEDIANGKTFKIEVKGLNLKDEYYDVKVYIYDDDKDSPISETKNENDDWVSSTDYYEEFFQGPGNKTKDITLRIKEKYENLSGDFTIGVRIREAGESDILDETTEDIEVLEKEEEETPEEKEEPEVIENEEKPINEEPEEKTVRLKGSNENKTNTTEAVEESGSGTVYESSNEKMKRYVIYALNFLLIIIIIFLVKNKV